MTRILSLACLSSLFAGAALANISLGGSGGVPVPEIDAVAGVAALAVVGAAVALIRERTKR